MTTCQSCIRPVSAELWPTCSSYRGKQRINRRNPRGRVRSTKGASKVRRDEINREIQNMRQLLPIRPAERGRLSYLHSMAAICTFIRKSFFYPELQTEGSRLPLLCGDFLQALPGFIVALTGEGKLLYVSENVSDYLGFSMVDVLQWDSFYDMVDRVNVQTVRSHLESDRASGAGRAFVCGLRCSKPFRLRQESGACSMLVQGRFLTPPSDRGEVFIALCTPTVNRLPDDIAQGMMGNFQSKHALDMSFSEASECVLFHLGYASEELIGQSWYGLLHPGDLSVGEAAHKRLLQGDDGVSVEMVLRLQCKDLSWVWLYVRAGKHAGTQGQEVSCTSYIISVTEARFLRKKTGADPPRTLRSPIPITPRQGGGTSGGCKRQREELRPQEEQWAKRAAIHAWDTPISPATLPVSPYSIHSEAQSPPLKYNQTLEVPSCQPLPQISDSTHQPCGLDRISPQTYIPACSMQLVPDFLSTSGPVYPDAFSHPACPSRRPVHSPTLLTPDPSPIERSSNLYSQEETSILAQQISSLANSFPEYRSQNPTHHSAESTTHITDVNSNQHPRPTHSPVHDINRTQSPIHSLSSTLTLGCYLSPDYSLNSAHSPVHNLDPTLNPTRNQSTVHSPAHNLNPTHSPIHNLNSTHSLNPAHSTVHDLNCTLSPTHSLSSSLRSRHCLSPTCSQNPTHCSVYNLNPTHSPVHNLNSALSPTHSPVHNLNPTHSPVHNLNSALSPTHSPVYNLNPTHSPVHNLNSALSPTHSPVHNLNPTHSPVHNLNSALSPTHSPVHNLNPTHSPVHNLNSTLSPTHSLSPAHSPAHSLTCDFIQPSGNSETFSSASLGQVMLFAPELILDDPVTDGILWHLDQVPPLPDPTPSCILPPPCGVGGQRAHGHVIFSAAQEDKLSPTMQPCTLKSGCHGNSTAFYQLDQCPCCTLLQGGLAEESMY